MALLIALLTIAAVNLVLGSGVSCCYSMELLLSIVCTPTTVSYLHGLFTVLYCLLLPPGHFTPVKKNIVQAKPAYGQVHQKNTNITMDANPAYMTIRGEWRPWLFVDIV